MMVDTKAMTVAEMIAEAIRIDAEARANCRKGQWDFRNSYKGDRFAVAVVGVDMSYNGRRRHSRLDFYVDGRRTTRAAFEQAVTAGAAA